MSKKFKKIILAAFLSMFLLGVLSGFAGKQVQADNSAIVCQPPLIQQGANCVNPTTGTTDTTNYKLLVPLPCPAGNTTCSGTITNYDTSSNANGQSTAIGLYLNTMITIFIGLCAVMSVVMIVVGGMQYMTAELISSKEAGKERIQNALLGLLIALCAWTLLHQINPAILSNTDPSIANVAITVPALTQAQQIANFTGGGQCTPVTNSSSQCSAANLASWDFAGDPSGTQASSICNGESGGATNQVSTTDVGSDGKGFSFGLFQINALAHANDIIDPSNGSKPCQGVWKVNSNDPNAVPGYSGNTSATLGSCLQLDKSGKICVKYSNTVINQTQYNTCQAFLTNPTNNTAYAAKLLDNTSWNSWGANTSCHF